MIAFLNSSSFVGNSFGVELNYILPFRIVTVLSRLFHFDIRPLCRGRYEKGEFERGVAGRNCVWHKLYNHFLLLKIVLEKERINIYSDPSL